jgi:ABC-type transport system involved in multi-copper enzyme maturation permease subunit
MKMLAGLLALVFFVLGILYWTGTIQFGSSHSGPHHAHAVLFIVLALLSLVWMRFQPGASTPSRTR